MIKKLLGLIVMMQVATSLFAASFSSELGKATYVNWHYIIYENQGDAGLFERGSIYGNSMIMDGQSLTLLDGYYEVVSGPGYTYHYYYALEIDSQNEVDNWVDFEEDVPNSTFYGQWTPSEDGYNVDQLVHQNREVFKRVKKGKRYLGYEKDVVEEPVYDFEFRSVWGTRLLVSSAPTSENASVAVNTSWSPSLITPGSGGTPMFCVAGPTAWGTANWTPTAVGTYTFYVAIKTDPNYSSNATDPIQGAMQVNFTAYTLVVY